MMVIELSGVQFGLKSNARSGAQMQFFSGGCAHEDRFFSPGADFAARANYILLRSYRINSNAVIFQFLLF